VEAGFCSASLSDFFFAMWMMNLKLYD
jgi:hypothetical protein